MKNATKYTIFLYLKEKEGEKTMRSERDFFLSKYYAYLWISFWRDVVFYLGLK